MTTAFVPHIEGLRALAVVPIVLFHLDERLCPGGFTGVDIFFVISGYLITRMIVAEGAAFRFSTFYARRIFRLLPALVATLLGTLVAGWFVLAPSDYVALARSALAALVGAANVHFFLTVDYFSAGSRFPLLHTWSLGVEEQFYLVWPLALWLLVLGRPGRSLLVVAGIVAVASFTAAMIIRPYEPEFAFYMMPLRAFELAIGALLVGLEPKAVRLSPMLAGTLSIGALLALAGSFALLGGGTPWPGPEALVPILATATVILIGSRGPTAAVLGCWPMRVVGRLSYALYLVHWPILTLYRTHAVVEVQPAELVILTAAIVAAAALLHFAVEQPFRLRRGMTTTRGWRGHGTVAAAGLLAIGAAGLIGYDGVPQRLDATRVQWTDKGLTFAGDRCSFKRSVCAFGDLTSPRIVYLAGDSHALNLVHGLDEMFRAEGIKGIALYDHGCLFVPGSLTFGPGGLDRSCKRNVERTFEILSSTSAPVILVNSWAGYLENARDPNTAPPRRIEPRDYAAWLAAKLGHSIDTLGRSRRLVIFLQAYDTGIDLARCELQPGSADSRRQKCRPTTRATDSTLTAALDARMAEVAARVPYAATIDPKAVFCREETCTTRNDRGLFFRDTTHLTNAGSSYLIEQVRADLMRKLGL